MTECGEKKEREVPRITVRYLTLGDNSGKKGVRLEMKT